MKINCEKCGNLIYEGEIGENKKHKKVFYMNSELHGEIHKNHSNNPKDWTGQCSKCQRGKDD